MTTNSTLLAKAKKIMTMRPGNAFFARDLYVLSAIHRSIKLNEAFLLLSRNNNYDASIPLLRLLLDSSLRIHALSMVKDPEMTAREVLGGKSLNKIRFNGKITLKDSELLKDIESHIPGIDKCYKSLSSFIHLSDTHFLAMFTENKINIGGNALSNNTCIKNQITTLHEELNILCYFNFLNLIAYQKFSHKIPFSPGNDIRECCQTIRRIRKYILRAPIRSN